MLVSPSGETVTSLPPPKVAMLLSCGDCELRELVLWPDERLRQKAVEVEDPTSDEVRKLVGDLAFTMYSLGGVGLSANQIGSDLSVCVVDIFNMAKPKPGQPRSQLLVLINPKIVWTDGEVADSQKEGCLSVPSVTLDVIRFQTIIAEGVDMEGNLWSLKTDGFLSRVVQHEIDHLNGNVMFDRVPKRTRIKAEKSYNEFQAAIQGNINEDAIRKKLTKKLEEAKAKAKAEAEVDEEEVAQEPAPKPPKRTHRKVRVKRVTKKKKRR